MTPHQINREIEMALSHLFQSASECQSHQEKTNRLIAELLPGLKATQKAELLAGADRLAELALKSAEYAIFFKDL